MQPFSQGTEFPTHNSCGTVYYPRTLAIRSFPKCKARPATWCHLGSVATDDFFHSIRRMIRAPSSKWIMRYCSRMRSGLLNCPAAHCLDSSSACSCSTAPKLHNQMGKSVCVWAHGQVGSRAVEDQITHCTQSCVL